MVCCVACGPVVLRRVGGKECGNFSLANDRKLLASVIAACSLVCGEKFNVARFALGVLLRLFQGLKGWSIIFLFNGGL